MHFILAFGKIKIQLALNALGAERYPLGQYLFYAHDLRRAADKYIEIAAECILQCGHFEQL